jgi:hypothetical protein
MQEVSRRSFIAGATAAGVASGLTFSGPALGKEESNSSQGDVASKTAAANPENGTLRAGYLNYFDWLGDAPELTEGDCSSTVDADVVVIGGGNSGVCCACAAAESGATVAVVEQQEQDAYTFLGHDIGTVNCQFAIDHGAEQIDPITFINEWTRRNSNRVNPELTNKFANNSGASLDWILGHLPDDIKDQCGVFGVPLPSEYPGSVSGFSCWSAAIHFNDTEGSGADWPDAAKTLVAAAEASGATWHFGQTAKVLVKDGSGRVTGAIAQNANGNLTLFRAAKGVVLSAGDYSANSAMVFGLNDEYRNFLEARGLDWTGIAGMMGRNGDGQRMGCWAGGHMEPGPRASMGRAMGAGCFGGLALPQFNRNGKRFMNEAMLGVWGNMFQVYRQPKGMIFAIADANWEQTVQKNPPEHVYPGTGGFHDGGFLESLKEELANVEPAGSEGYKIRGCQTYAAQTLDELADYLGLDPAVKQTFLEQVQRYNDLCAQGADEDFGKDSFLMDPISEPPFYASVVMDSSQFSLGLVELSGLSTDGNQQVLDSNDDPIPGLYATGNCCGGRFALQYHTPIAGISIGWATTMGKLLGDELAAL